METMLGISLHSYLNSPRKMLCLPYYTYVFSTTKLEIRAEQILPKSDVGGGESVVWSGERNDPNNVCTCEYMN
jgi:hypothetical protein